MKRAAAFDFDGTIFETMRIEMDAFNTALSAMGQPVLDEPGVAYFIGMKMPKVLAELLPGGTTAQRQELDERILAAEKQAIGRCGRLYAGAGEMLAALHSKGVDIYICSNGGHEYLMHACAHCGINSLIAHIYHTGNCEGKAHALKEIKSKYDAVTFAGDREEDIAAAREAGCTSIACVYGYGGGKDYGAEHAAHDIFELHQAINRALELSINNLG